MQTLPRPTKSSAPVRDTGFQIESALARAGQQIRKASRAVDQALDEATAAGAMLIEIREALKASQLVPFRGVAKPDFLKFEVVLERAGAEFGASPATLYRWMEMAEVGCRMLADHAIDVVAMAVPVSKLLTCPAEELASDAARGAQQLLFAWMKENPTMRERMGSVAVGGDEASALKRAYNGQTKGGTGGDRKDFPLHISQHLVRMSSVIQNWEKWRQERPGQFAEMSEALRISITGGRLRANAQGSTREVKGWPRAFCELLNDLLKERLKRKDAQ